MKLIEYARFVKSVRDAQNEYFRNRRQSDLVRSKSLERQLDLQTQKILASAEVTEQRSN